MRYLLPIALLLTACGSNVAPGDGSGDDAGTAPTSWAGRYLQYDSTDWIPCDGGGLVSNEGILGSSFVNLAETDGGVGLHYWRGPFISIDADGRAASERMKSTWLARTPNGTDTHVYTRVTGRFSAGPSGLRQFDGTLDLDAWDGQCRAAVETHWRQYVPCHAHDDCGADACCAVALGWDGPFFSCPPEESKCTCIAKEASECPPP